MITLRVCNYFPPWTLERWCGVILVIVVVADTPSGGCRGPVLVRLDFQPPLRI